MPRVIRTITLNSTASDANFRAFVSEVESLLAACGLVRTTDTGQINSATVALPSVATFAGYSVWRFNDPLQSAAPVFLKFQFGVGASTNRYATTLQIGKETDGAGNLVAATSTAVISSVPGTASSTASTTCYATHSAGFFAISFGLGYYPAAYTGCCDWIVERVNDNTGAATAEGVVVVGPSANGQRALAPQSVVARYLPSFSLTTGGALGFVPFAVNDSKVGLSPQLPLHFVPLPKWRPLVGTASNIAGEVTEGQTFEATLVGTVPRTYIGLGGAFGCTAGTSPTTHTAVLWEE
ncbi:hypothetical protein ABE493_07915 [Stenotrophomonas terrae]|uniref:hypothetical protein n=1 Tax=Stenotrophomonas terrae TaxID=405446 RepID=UPI00320B54CE